MVGRELFVNGTGCSGFEPAVNFRDSIEVICMSSVSC